MRGILFCLLATLIVTEIAAYTLVTLPGTITFTAQPSPPKYTWKYTYYENGWNTTGWIQFASDPQTSAPVVPLFVGHGNYYDVDLYLNQYCKPYFYSRGYMCFGPTLTHYVGCPSVAYGLTNNDCADSPENLRRSTAAVDILFSTQFQTQFGSNVIIYDSFAAFGHSYGAFLMTAFAAVESRLTSAVVMSGGKKTYGTQYTDEYYAQTKIPLLRVHGINDSAVDPSDEDAENAILAKGGIRTFYLLFNNQPHAWVISTVGGVMHDWYKTYDPRNNSAVIPVITGISFSNGVVKLTGRGFGSNPHGWSSVLKNEVLPYTAVPGPYTWSDSQITFAAASVSSSYIVANADSSSYATGEILSSFGGVFSVTDLTPIAAPVTPPVAPVAAPVSTPTAPPAAPVASPVYTPTSAPTASPVADTPVSSPVDPPVDVPLGVGAPMDDVPVADTPSFVSSTTDSPVATTPSSDQGTSSGSATNFKLVETGVLLFSALSIVLLL